MTRREDLQERLRDVERRISDAASRAGRSPDDVQLIAVSKTYPDSDIMALYDAGQRHFGENYAQEWQDKSEGLPDDIIWHFIGRLQSNKAKYLVDRVGYIHSVDRRSVMKALHKRCHKDVSVLLQINTGNDVAKGGVEPADAVDALLEMVTDFDKLVPVGLMTIPPFGEPLDVTRGHFAQMRELFGECRAALAEADPGLAQRFEHLSMGMTSDFEIAIQEGATMVRVGTAIFGERG